MILRNGYIYDTKDVAIATIKSLAFLESPGMKAEGLQDGEPILARYWAYFERKTEGGVTTFTEEFPVSSTDMANYTFVRELEESGTDGYYKVIRVLFGITTAYILPGSSDITRQLEIFDNKDSIDERFTKLEQEIEDVAIDLTQTDATGTDATLLSTLTLDADGRTLHKTIAKIIGSNSVNVTTTVDTTANPDEKNITISLTLDDAGGLVDGTDGLYVNADNVTVGVDGNNQVYVKHGTTLIQTSTDGLDVNFDNSTIIQDSNNSNKLTVNFDDSTIKQGTNNALTVNFDDSTIKQGTGGALEVNIDGETIRQDATSEELYVKYDESTMTYDSTNGIGAKYDNVTIGVDTNGLKVKTDGTTIQVDNTNGLYVPIDNDSIVYVGGSTDHIEVKYDHATILMGTNGLEVDYDNKSIKYDSVDGLYVDLKQNGGISLSGTDGLYINPSDFISTTNGLQVIPSGTDAGKIGVKVDGETIDFNANGELIVKDALITDNFFDGQGIILEKDAAANTVKIIADVYNGNNSSSVNTVDILRFVNGAESGTDNQVIAAKLGLTKITDGLETNVREAYQLVDANGNTFGEQIKIYKDSSLVKTAMGYTSDDLVAAWDTGSTPYYTCQGTTAHPTDPTDPSDTVPVYDDAACTHSVGVGTITDENGTLILTMNSTEYTPSESDFTTKEGTGTADDALIFIYRLSDGTYSLVAIDLETYLSENEFDPHSFDTTSTPHHIYMKFKSDGGLETGTGDDNDGLRIKLASGAGLLTTANGLALNVATTDVLGGIRLFGGAETTGTDNYRVQLDSNNKAYVNLSDFEYHHGLTVTAVTDGGTDTTVLNAWNPSADGSIAITSDDFINLTPSTGSILIGINTSTDIANTTSTDALISVPTTQAVIDYFDAGSVISGYYLNPEYNTSTENPSVMDPTILANVVENGDTYSEGINKIDNKLAAVFNGLLEYEALNASALEAVRIGTGLEQNFIYVPYADSVIENATNLYEADVLLADRLYEVGTDLDNIHMQINTMGTEIADLQVTVNHMGTDIAKLQTDVAHMGTDIADLQTTVAHMGTDIADLQNKVDSMGTDIEYLMDNKLDEVIGDDGILVGPKTQTSTDVYKQTIKLDLAPYMYTETGVEIQGLASNLQFSSTDGNGRLIMTNVWDCGVY